MMTSKIELHRSLLILFVLTGLVMAQSSGGGRPRALFTTKQADGLEIKVLKNDKGVFSLVDPGQEFKSGDEIRVVFTSNFDGNVYFINVAPSGASRVIYRREIRAGQVNELPAGQEVIKFDKEVGDEVLKIVMSRKPLAVFEDALKKTDGKLGLTAASVVDEIVKNKPGSKPHAENVGIVEPDNSRNEMRCRGLELALGKEVRCRGLELATGDRKKGEGTVLVARQDDDGGRKNSASGELKPDDVAVIEIRLRHK